MDDPTDRDHELRATALHAAATWLSGVDPFPSGARLVLDTAEQFACWLAEQEGEK
jgi:hypothetical protein